MPDKVNRSKGEKLVQESAAARTEGEKLHDERLRDLELKGVTVWQEANARQKVMLDRMTDKFRAIYEIAYSVNTDSNFSDLGVEAKNAIIAIREELNR